jgi:5,10-methylene-tetrahydrofolate dehydrogenase/methenyl tetrahydrofolate cyclohydrolase
MFLRNFVFEMFAPVYFNMIIDGKKEAAILREEIKKEIESLKSKNNKVPGLTVILIGDFAPSQIYVKNKEKNAKEVGINSDVVDIKRCNRKRSFKKN